MQTVITMEQGSVFPRSLAPGPGLSGPMGIIKEPLARMALMGLLFLPAAHLQTVLVFLSCGKSAPDMAFRLVDIQNHPCSGG